MSSQLSHIARELKESRKKKGLSQDALARKSGISRAALISIEKGSTNMSLQTFLGLLEALGMDLRMVPKPSERGRVEGRFPNFEEIRKMRLEGEL